MSPDLLWVMASAMLVMWMPGMTHATLFIHPDTPQCNLHGSALKCDFGFVKENVVLESLPEAGGARTPITVIYIHNANKVLIPRASCVDMSFYTVHIVHFSSTDVCPKKLISLRLTDSTVNQVPRQLSRLEATRSKVDQVNCDLGLQRLTVTSSEVGELNAPWPVAGAYSIRIEHSTIKKFTALNIESRVTLNILNSTLGSMPRESLTLGKGSTTTITNSFITFSEDNAIIVKTGAKFVLRSTEGKIAIAGPQPGKENEYEHRPPGVPSRVITPPPIEQDDDVTPKNPQHADCQSITWVWFIPTVVATVEALVIIVQCGKKYPPKRRVSMGPDMENPVGGFGGRPGFGAPPPDSSLSFYTESSSTYQQPILRRR